MNKTNNIEIERKFILKRVPRFPLKDVTKLLIHQIYFDIENKVHRFRMTENLGSENIERTYVECVKSPISSGVFEEIENDITEDYFSEIILNSHKYIIKTRYVYYANGLKWEVDEYHDIKLVVLEVELEDIHQQIEIPDIIEKEMIVEVTGQKVFSNYNLSIDSDYGV